jgi:hypothetical protein
MPLGPSACVGRSEGRVGGSLSLEDAALSNNAFRAIAQYLLFGEGLAGADLGAGRRVQMPSFWVRSTCPLCAAATFPSILLLQTAIVSSVVSSEALGI